MKQIIANTFLLLVVLYSISSCKNEKPHLLNIQHAVTIPIDNQSTNRITIDSIINKDSIAFIPLETINNSLLSSITHLLYSNPYWIVADSRLKKVLLFDKSGEYIREIGKYGKGPNEHNGIMDIKYNRYSNIISILDHSLNLKSYTIYGEKRGIDQPLLKTLGTSLFSPMGKNAYAVYNSFNYTNYSSAKHYRFFTIEGNGLLSKNLYYNGKRDIEILNSSRQFYTFRDTIRFFETYAPIVYNVSKNGLSPRYFFEFPDIDFGSNFLNGDPSNALSTSPIHDFHLNSITETDNWLFLQYSKDKIHQYSLYNKTRYASLGVSTSGFEISELNLTVSDHFYEIAPNKIVVRVFAEEMFRAQQEIKGTRHPSKRSDLVNKFLQINIRPTDNPVLMILKLR